MGWCTEFAHRIEHNCDEPMVAGKSSCSCSSCGVVCTGKFPACAQVWDRAKKPVVLRLSGPTTAGDGGPTAQPVTVPSRPKLSGATPAVATPTNGGSPSHPAPVEFNHGRGENGNGNGSAPVQDLLSEMRLICSRLEQASTAWETRDADGEAKLQRLLAQLQLLPDQIARGLSAAMREQHHLIMRDVKIALDELTRDLRSSDSFPRPGG